MYIGCTTHTIKQHSSAYFGNRFKAIMTIEYYRTDLIFFMKCPFIKMMSYMVITNYFMGIIMLIIIALNNIIQFDYC